MATIEFLLSNTADLPDGSALLLTTDPQAETGSLVSSYLLESFPGWGEDQPKGAGYFGTPPEASNRDSQNGTLLLRPLHDALVERSSYLYDTYKVPASEATDGENGYQLYRAETD